MNANDTSVDPIFKQKRESCSSFLCAHTHWQHMHTQCWYSFEVNDKKKFFLSFSSIYFMSDKIYWNKIVIITLCCFAFFFSLCSSVCMCWRLANDDSSRINEAMDEYHWNCFALLMWMSSNTTTKTTTITTTLTTKTDLKERNAIRMTWLTLIMGQNPKWHAEQLNRYISDFSKTIHSISNLDNYHSTNHFTSSGSANDRSDNFVQNLANSDSVTSSNSLSPLSTATLQLNNRIQSLTHRQLHNFSSSFVDRFSDAIQSALTSEQQATNSNVTKLGDNATTTVATAADDDGSIISNYWMLLLIVLYFVVVLGGIFGNASLIVTLFTQSSARLRNPLLVALCIADLMVTGVAAPLTVVALFLDARKTIISTHICKIIHFAQVSYNYFFHTF